MVMIFFYFFDSPKEKILNREIKQLNTQYEIVLQKLQQVENVLDDIQERDDNIYRVIFEADPIPISIRKAGYGGINRYEHLNGYSNSEIVVSTNKLLLKHKVTYINSRFF
jgi:hypothetical protein